MATAVTHTLSRLKTRDRAVAAAAAGFRAVGKGTQEMHMLRTIVCTIGPGMLRALIEAGMDVVCLNLIPSRH